MLWPWEWPENRLLVNVRNRAGAEGYLVNLGVTQEAFFEHYCNRWSTRDGYIQIVEMSVVPIDQRTYDMLEEYYPDSHKVGD